MGYKIQYGPASEAEIKSRTFWKKHWKAAALLTAAVIVSLTASGKIEPLRDIFLPGDAEVTRDALAEMTEKIRGGEGVADAITAFCREIIEGAEIS